tara:strand:+ start:973 stop:3135 length:2163 start_codon:yes stop_codon:yes gene_type:complete
MAKEGILIDRYEGGVNNKDSQKDLPNGFLAEAKNVDVSEIGRIQSLGSFVALGSLDAKSVSGDISTFQPGHGLFSFRTDEQISGSIAAGDFLAYTNPNDRKLSIGNTSQAFTNVDSAILGGSNTAIEPVYYYANGGLRVADGDLSHTTESLALLHLKRVVAEAPSYSGSNLNDYKFTRALLDAPADADLQVETDSTETNGPKDPNAAATVLNAPTSSTKIRIGLASKAAESGEVDGLLAEGRYIIGVSYVYVDNQESFINESLGSIDVSDGHVIVIAASILDDAFTGDLLFAQGFRVYLKNYNDLDDDFRLVLDVNLEKGSRTSLGDDFDPLQAETGGANHMHTHDPKGGAVNRAYLIQNLSAASYSEVNGFELEEHAISFYNSAFGYKTATVANQRAFVANVKYKDADGETKLMGDRIQYSPVRRYDTFPQSYNIDVGTNDGDEIVKIIEFQDRLFVYKKRKLFIIDISSPNVGEYKLIGEFDNRGISNPGAVVKSDLGIVWANENGLFGYFEGIAKLSKAINDKNDTDGWADIVDADNVQLGFIPLKNQILIVANANSASSKGYIYDINTQSFVNVDTSSVIFNNEITNMVRFGNDLCLVEQTGLAKKFDTTTVSQTIDIQTKEYDFGQPSVDKRLMKVYITHKAGDNLTLQAAYDGGSFGNKFASNTLSDSATMTQSTFTVSTIENCKSMQFKIAGTAEADFVLEDISVVYRRKGLR